MNHEKGIGKDDEPLAYIHQLNNERKITICNNSGIDMEISLYDIIGHNNEVMDDDVMSVFLESGRSIVINAGAMTKMNMTPSESTVDLIGERETIIGVSLDHVVGDSIKKIALLSKESIQNARYLIEPVVEFCMQNQRLRSASKNGLGIDTGVDILSSQNW